MFLPSDNGEVSRTSYCVLILLQYMDHLNVYHTRTTNFASEYSTSLPSTTRTSTAPELPRPISIHFIHRTWHPKIWLKKRQCHLKNSLIHGYSTAYVYLINIWLNIGCFWVREQYLSSTIFNTRMQKSLPVKA